MDNLSNVIKDIIKQSVRIVARNFKKILHAPDDKVEHLTPNEEALKKALQQCRKEIKKCKRWKVMPSKKCFEHAAMLSRQAKNYQKEIAICQLYISLVDECLSRRTFNKKKVERKAHLLCKPLIERILIAKNLNKNSGVEVSFL
ncbi:MAG: hypothetical protein KJO81_04375 [Gammaproteobacteria bacterium]|nr:hypothetical protein [Gammaproteobacteria bacterium]